MATQLTASEAHAMVTLGRYPYCCNNCGAVEVGTEAPEGWVYSEVVDAGPLPDYSYWLCEGCSYDVYAKE